MIKLPWLALGFLAVACMTALPAAAKAKEDEPSAFDQLPRKPLSERIPVTIYRFRSSLNWVDPQAATDMFVTALVKSGQFRVVERAQLQPDIAVEHALNANGQSTGDVAQQKLTGAKYIFEGVVSDSGQQTDSHSGGINVAGMTVGGGSSAGVITIDVRIIDAGTGDVLDAVTVSQKLGTRQSSVHGVGNLIGNMTRGSLGAYTPDIDAQSSHDDNYSDVLRATMEDSVVALVKDIG